MCQLTEGYSMEYKYKQDNIPSAIARAIFENEKQNKKGGMSYRNIHFKVEQLLNHPLSDRQLVKNLSNMAYEKLLTKYIRLEKEAPWYTFH